MRQSLWTHMEKRVICSYINNPGPMVVFATPGMLHGGLSLTIFEEWCTGAEVATIQ